MTSRGLIIHVGRGCSSIKGSLLQALHGFVLRMDRPRGDSDLKIGKKLNKTFFAINELWHNLHLRYFESFIYSS